jgi:hypothetical protein
MTEVLIESFSCSILFHLFHSGAAGAWREIPGLNILVLIVVPIFVNPPSLS